jgi:hypothetical protein
MAAAPVRGLPVVAWDCNPEVENELVVNMPLGV